MKTSVDEIRFKSYRPAEVLTYVPIVERADAHTVRFRGTEVARFVEFVLDYEPGLAP